MKSYLFEIESGYMTLVNPSARPRVRYDGEGVDRVLVRLEEIRSSDLTFGPGETLRIVDDEVAVVPRPTPPPPDEVTQKQLRLAMLAAGIDFDQVEAQIDALGGQDAAAVRIEWQYSERARRSHPMISAIGSQLGLTEDQIDDIFRAAALID